MSSQGSNKPGDFNMMNVRSDGYALSRNDQTTIVGCIYTTWIE
jgi:hypothetical protein